MLHFFGKELKRAFRRCTGWAGVRHHDFEKFARDCHRLGIVARLGRFAVHCCEQGRVLLISPTYR